MAKVLGLMLALLLLAAPAASASSEPSGTLLAGSEETVLRLHDLPPGYQVGDDSGCGPQSPGGEEGGPEGQAARRYLRWIAKFWPEGCSYQYEQIFRAAKPQTAPPLVEAETLNTPSEAAATTGFRLITALLDRKAWRHRRTVAIAPSGTEAVLIHSRDQLVAGKKGQSGTFVLWHFGTLTAAVGVAGGNPRSNDRAARRFAEIQQARLEAPTSYTEAERDDTEVRLDDPSLRSPVYWVGSTFAPGNGLPTVDLEEALAGAVGPVGEKISLWYEGFDLDAWTSASWRRFARSRLGRVNLHARCTSTEPQRLDHGRAVIYATYDGRFRACPRRKPDRFYAVAHLGGMVVGVNLSNCLKCRPGADDPYGSRRGTVAILRALTVRPKPVYRSRRKG